MKILVGLWTLGLVVSLGFGQEGDFCLRCSPWPEFSPGLAGCKAGLIAVYVESPRPWGWVVSASYSKDRGETFEYLGALGIEAACKECSLGWPTLATAPDGTLYLALMAGDQILVLRSLDCKTFLPVFSLPFVENSHSYFYPSIFVQSDRIYLVASDIFQKRVFVHASDPEGRREGWRPITDDGVLGRLVGYNSRLYSAFIRWTPPVDFLPPLGIPDGLAPLGDLLVQYCKLHPAELIVALSSDGGRTWVTSPPLASINIPAKVGDRYASFVSAGLEAPFFVNLAVEPRSGNVYITFQGANEEGDMDVFVVGVNADLAVVLPPTRVRNEPGKERFLPNVALAPNGTIGVAFYELDQSKGHIDVWLGTSTDGGQTFVCQRLTAVSSPIPPVVGQPTRSGHFDPSMPPGYIGEVLGIWADETFFYVAWTDFRNRVVSPDYPSGRPDMDLYFARVPVR